MSILPIQPKLVPIPLDLNTTLPNPLTPWEISSRIFKEMQTQKQVPYKKVQVLPRDPEWRFIWRYFHSDKPCRYGIKRIFCIFERQQQQLFETYFSAIEVEAKISKPTWDQEPRSKQRDDVIKRWHKAASVFSPVTTTETDGRVRNWTASKVLPLWHGSTQAACDSIAKSGFAFFGKTSLGGKKPKSTDDGFFGSGIYFTNSARYAADIYSKGHILLGWVSMREPFPVVGDPNQEDMKILSGKGHYKDYNAHYVPVASANPSDPFEPYYYPVQPGDLPHCDEIVVFQKIQTLLRFWIELHVEAPYLMSPSNIPQFVEDFIPHLLKLFQNSEIDKDKKLRNCLGDVLGIMLTLPEDDYLDNQYQLLYTKLTKLLDHQGKINKQVSLDITGATSSSAPTPAPLSPPSLTSLTSIAVANFPSIPPNYPASSVAGTSQSALPSISLPSTSKINSPPFPSSYSASSLSKKPIPQPIAPSSNPHVTHKYSSKMTPTSGVSLLGGQKSGMFGEKKVCYNKYGICPSMDDISLPLTPLIHKKKVTPSSSTSAPPINYAVMSSNALPSVPVPDMAFGKTKWLKYFGDIGTEPPLPKEIEAILDSPCPFWGDKKVRDTHLLVLIPETVNGNALTLNYLDKLIRHPKEGNKTLYNGRTTNREAFRKYFKEGSMQSHWILITRDLIPSSEGKAYKIQKELIASYANKMGLPYGLPKGLEAAVAILANYVQTGERLPFCTRTATKEKKILGPQYYTMRVGPLRAEGLSIHYGNTQSVSHLGATAVSQIPLAFPIIPIS